MITREYINLKMKNNKYRNSLIHKYKKFFVFMFMFIALCMPTKAYANMQSQVTGLLRTSIQTDRSTGQVNPKVTVQWTAPIVSSQEEAGSSLLEGESTALHAVSGYQIFLKCISNSEDWRQIGEARSNETSYIIDQRNLKPGLIYQVMVRPYHYHKYMDGDDIASRLATMTGNDVIATFITEPEVKTWSEGTTLYVQFDDGGQWVNYTILHELLTQDPFRDTDPSSTPVASRATMTSSIVDGRSKLTYTINDSAIQAGQVYSILVKARDILNDDLSVMVSQDKNVYQCATRAPFNITEESNNFLKLSWSGLSLNGVDSIDIYVKDSGSTSEGRIYSSIYPKDGNNNVDFYLLTRPKNKTTYWIVVNYGTGTNRVSAESEHIDFDPNLINITPGKTVITVGKDKESNGLEINWTPFRYNGQIYFDTKYDILVTDDISNVLPNLNVNSISDYFVTSGSTMAEYVTQNGYRTTTDEYITSIKDANGNAKGLSLQKLKANTVYYVRVIGKTESNGITLLSDPSVVAFYLSSDEIMYLPPSLPKPPLVKKGVTDKTATIEWNTEWYEMCGLSSESFKDGALDLNKDWLTMIYVIDNNGTLAIYHDEANAKLAARTLGKTYTACDISVGLENIRYSSKYPSGLYALLNSDRYYFRRVSYNIGNKIGSSQRDVKYEGFYIEDTIASQYRREDESEEDFLNRYIENFDDLWKELEVKTNGDYTETTYGLPKENTTYWLILRAYRYDESGNKVTATKPSAIIVTTTLAQGQIEPVPTVPTLVLTETKDISAKFKWEFSTELQYELRYSETEDVNTATPVMITNEMLNAIDAPIEGLFYNFEQVDLFPLTGYYVWIKAKQVKGNLESAWSNPLVFITCDLLPDPRYAPGGIGVAPQTDAITENHITLEWSRVPEDIELDKYTGTVVLKNISYVMQIADNVKFLDCKEIECGGFDAQTGSNNNASDFLVYSKTMARALNLKSNTRYYVRLKTRIVVRDTKSQKELSKESPWSLIKIFKTKSINEYDSEYGDIDVPIPEKTIMIYNGDTARMNVNNDDAVITEMIKQGLFEYMFDFSNEKSSYTRREVFIPLSVLTAMQNMDMSIQMKTKDTTLNVHSKAFKNLDYENLTRQGGVQGLVLTINDDNSIYPINVLSKDIGAYFSTKYGDYKTMYLEDYMEVLFDTTKSVYFSKNKAKGVTYDSKTRNWKDADSYTLGYNLIVKTGHTGKVGISY